MTSYQKRLQEIEELKKEKWELEKALSQFKNYIRHVKRGNTKAQENTLKWFYKHYPVYAMEIEESLKLE